LFSFSKNVPGFCTIQKITTGFCTVQKIIPGFFSSFGKKIIPSFCHFSLSGCDYGTGIQILICSLSFQKNHFLVNEEMQNIDAIVPRKTWLLHPSTIVKVVLFQQIM
jgi:hypothetical protein